MLVTRALMVVLLAAACTSSEETPPPASKAADAPTKTADAPTKAADVDRLGKLKVEVPVGGTFTQTFTYPRNPGDHASWSAEPKIEGTCVRFVDRVVEPPPADVDGGQDKFHYRFEAIVPGRAEVTFTLSSPGSTKPIQEQRVAVVVIAK